MWHSVGWMGGIWIIATTVSWVICRLVEHPRPRSAFAGVANIAKLPAFPGESPFARANTVAKRTGAPAGTITTRTITTFSRNSGRQKIGSCFQPFRLPHPISSHRFAALQPLGSAAALNHAVPAT